MRGNHSVAVDKQPIDRSIPACAGEPTQAQRGTGLRPVYPRVCGGTGVVGPATFVPRGLSPRVRGNPVRHGLSGSDLGSIPACAGEPRSVPWPWGRSRVYPRVCGGTDNDVLKDINTWGLSPRVRGNRPCPRSRVAMRGSIPACAGEPTAGEMMMEQWGVYPRVCGGTWHCRCTMNQHRGLSPRVRGNRNVQYRVPEVVGSIPACAGEPPARDVWMVLRQVYPRVCGGTGGASERGDILQGLSPRVRGNRVGLARSAKANRSIPACAGEPVLPARWLRRCRVYPRVCGGTDATCCQPATTFGLSPRVRGNPCHPASSIAMMRSIPACAGEPEAGWHVRQDYWVYPRVCGGTLYPARIAACVAGLSPRVRGNLNALVHVRRVRGSIPACAGEPTYSSGVKTSQEVYPRVCGGTAPRN